MTTTNQGELVWVLYGVADLVTSDFKKKEKKKGKEKKEKQKQKSFSQKVIDIGMTAEENSTLRSGMAKIHTQSLALLLHHAY